MSGCFDDPKEVFERPFCVHAVSKALEGVAEPRDARLQPCDDHECKPLKTVTGLRLATPSYRCDSKFGKLLEKFEAPEFFAAFASLPALACSRGSRGKIRLERTKVGDHWRHDGDNQCKHGSTSGRKSPRYHSVRRQRTH